MTEIPVFNKDGDTSYILEIKDDLHYVSGRTSKSDVLYYKGAGTRYHGHSSLVENVYDGAKGSSIFYYGYDVINPNWLNKFGIFQERYQPFFSDFIGTCGKKELNILDNSRQFELSAVDVVDMIEYDPENKQYYIVLNYKAPRSSYNGNSTALISLLVYMIQSGWNFPWDKTSINDIDSVGCVTDVADLFYSLDDIHAFGTVYSVLYSLFQTNRVFYDNLMLQLGCSHRELSDIPFVSLFFLRSCGRKLTFGSNVHTKNHMYTHLVGNVLLRGRNCSGVEDITISDKVAVDYLDRFKATLDEDNLSILNN